MEIEERNNKLKHFITCMKCEVSGKCCDENCPTQYNAGNMGEIIENLEEISKILEREPRKGYWIEGQTNNPKIHNILKRSFNTVLIVVQEWLSHKKARIRNE